ncbi:FxSxx-COOH system tetratricopeptide repeat protein [Streptomyces noursei]|uniref:FxSxx-COOH system tetratricopeptide repeat protein n=1 Tax=Streptomyces noursei TaxID=1971 RepID=UPI001E6421EE|nr:FxSxx-COOH system tetratricopeptide repeat protein [Streptomyces noursei]
MQEMRRWLNNTGLSVPEAHERLLPEHFQGARVPHLRVFRNMLAGEKLTWDLVEAIADVCFPEEVGDLAEQRRREARAIWDKAQADPTPLGETNASPSELLAEKERTIRVYEQLTQSQHAYHVSEQGRQHALQVATVLFAQLGQAHAQIATLSRQVELELGTPSASGDLQVMRQHLERAQGQESDLREQLERAIRDRDRYQEVADHAARRIQVLESALRRLGGQPEPVDAPTLPDVQPLSLETYVSDVALDAVDATLRKARDVLDREQEAVQEAAEEVGWTTPPAPSFAEQHMAVVRGHVVRSPDALPESQPALAWPDSGRLRSRGVRLPVRNSVPPRNRHFTGREHLLGTVRQAFNAVGQAASCVLIGMGGCGKTQIAVEYVHQTLSHYDLVWWIPAESRDTVRGHLAALAPALGLMIGPSHEARIRTALEELSRHDGLRWLIVFDNADDPKGIRGLVPTGPGHVLITSRQQGWDAETVAHLSVPEYARQESIDHFLSRVPGLRDADADELAEILGDLPLAIEQAAVWLAETAVPVREYVTMLRQEAAEVPASYPKSVSKALTISMNHLEHTRPEALMILKLGTFFDPSGIPLTLLQRIAYAAWETDPKAWRDSLRELQHYALFQFDHERDEEAEDASDAGRMSMHRLVQAGVRDRLSEDERRTLAGLARQALATADPGNPSAPEQWPIYAELIPHLDASGALDSDDPGLDTFRRNCLRYLYTTRD